MIWASLFVSRKVFWEEEFWKESCWYWRWRWFPDLGLTTSSLGPSDRHLSLSLSSSTKDPSHSSSSQSTPFSGVLNNKGRCLRGRKREREREDERCEIASGCEKLWKDVTARCYLLSIPSILGPLPLYFVTWILLVSAASSCFCCSAFLPVGKTKTRKKGTK